MFHCAVGISTFLYKTWKLYMITLMSASLNSSTKECFILSLLSARKINIKVLEHVNKHHYQAPSTLDWTCPMHKPYKTIPRPLDKFKKMLKVMSHHTWKIEAANSKQWRNIIKNFQKLF